MIKQAKGVFTVIAILLMAGTAFLTWQIRGTVSSAEIATLEQIVERSKIDLVNLEKTLQAEIKLLERQRENVEIIFKEKVRSLETQKDTLSLELEEARKQASLPTNNYVNAPSVGAKIEIYPIRQRLHPPTIGFDIGFLNSGDAPAPAPLKIWYSYITENKPSADKIDAIFEELYQRTEDYKFDPKSTELWPSKASWLTMEVKRGAEKADDVLNGNARMYIFVLVAYTDLNDLDGPLKFTEGCFYTFKNQAIHNCKQRNRILLEGRR